MPAEAPRAVTLPHTGRCQRHVGEGKGSGQGPGSPSAPPGAELQNRWARPGGAALPSAGLGWHGPAPPAVPSHSAGEQGQQGLGTGLGLPNSPLSPLQAGAAWPVSASLPSPAATLPCCETRRETQQHTGFNSKTEPHSH